MRLKRIFVAFICIVITSTTLVFAAPSVSSLQSQINSLTKKVTLLLTENNKLKNQVSTLQKQVAQTINVKYVINGIEKSNTYKPATIVSNGTLYAPIQFISDSLNNKMTWDSGKKTVYISDTGAVVKPLKEISLYNKPYLDTNAQKNIVVDSNKKYLSFQNMYYSDNNNDHDANGVYRNKYYLTYQLNGKATNLLGSIFATDSDYGEIVVRVYDENDKLLYTSGGIKAGMDKVALNVDIKNNLKVKIELESIMSLAQDHTAIIENLRVLTTDYWKKQYERSLKLVYINNKRDKNKKA